MTALAPVLLELADVSHHHYLRGEVLRYLRRIGRPTGVFPDCPPPFAAGLEGDWRTAAALWDEFGNHYEKALELSESPERSAAFEGLEILDRLGAARAAAVVRRRLRWAGFPSVPRGPRPRTRSNPGGLTDRQVEILGMVANGLTSPEIAEQLVLSRRTVDNHIALILARTGARSRQEAVAAIERRHPSSI